MGKCTRKSEVTVDVSVVDVSQSYLGVRTRAKTLAIQRRQSTAAAALPPPNPDACYLDLRSRRLEKPMQPQKSRIVRHGCGCEGPQIGSRDGISGEGRVSGSIGENNLDFEGGESQRGTRENTPCSLIDANANANANTTPGSTTKKSSCQDSIGQRVFHTNVIPSHELEEFFTRAERSIQERFLEKYNFDFAKEVPLPGRFEWVAMGM